MYLSGTFAQKRARVLFILVFLLIYAFEVQAQKFWLTTYEFPGGPKVGITSVGDSNLFVATPTLVLRSSTLGRSWDTVLSASGIFSIYTSSGGKVFVGGTGKVFYSDDLGLTWDSVTLNSTFPVTQFEETTEGGLFLITGILDAQDGYVGAGVYYSSDNGNQWSQRNEGLGIYLSCQQIARDRNGRLYVACADEFASGNGGLFISDDNGLHWKHIDIFVDGQGAIESRLNIERTTALEITPSDSLIFSFLGVSRAGGPGVLVRFNLVKSIAEVEATSFWLPRMISNSSMWWTDRPLNNIHFAGNGDWYSSTSGSVSIGLTYFSQDQGITWKGFDYGLGLDIGGSRNIQYFTEVPNGKIFMVQLLDERIYWTDTSLKAAVSTGGKEKRASRIFPNPTIKGHRVQVNETASTFFIVDLMGNVLQRVTNNEGEIQFNAPTSSGMYFIRIGTTAIPFVVY